MFGYCSSLNEVLIPSTVKKVGPMAFINCTSLAVVNLSDGLEVISAMAFAGCTSLKEIQLPEGLTTIGEQAFYTTSLTGIIIPDSVRDIEKEVLDENGQPKLDDKGNVIKTTTYGVGLGAFHTCTEMKYAVIGKGIKTLRSGAFGYCPAMERLYLPKSIESIEGAYIEDGEVIYKHAFHHNKALAEVYFEGTEEEWRALLKNTNNDTVTVKGDSEKYDNSALFNAHINYESNGLPE
ncbi:MAG: leucine-rich repeat domain-containing protein [Clostridia bacterium]|nr:leucine-rich repeat domain-containing protein [Clostridia bacterium]